MPLSDQEIICTFMAWDLRTYSEIPPRLWLGLCWEVEERLTDEQWQYYLAVLLPEEFKPPFPLTAFQAVTHATPEKKITALAAVLRPIVEAQQASVASGMPSIGSSSSHSSLKRQISGEPTGTAEKRTL